MTAFYKTLLQQDLEFDFGACIVFKCGLSLWHPADAHPVAVHMGAANFAAGKFELCFETDDFEGAISALKQHQVQFLHGERTEPWGQYTTRFFDPENNLVELGESIPCFVRRLYNDGLSVSQVASRTSVPLETVKKICED